MRGGRVQRAASTATGRLHVGLVGAYLYTGAANAHVGAGREKWILPDLDACESMHHAKPVTSYSRRRFCGCHFLDAPKALRSSVSTAPSQSDTGIYCHPSNAICAMADEGAFVVPQPLHRLSLAYQEFSDRFAMRYSLVTERTSAVDFSVAGGSTKSAFGATL